MKILMLYKANQHRSLKVCSSFQRVLLRKGHKMWTNLDTTDMAIIYGMGPGHKEAFDRLRAEGKNVLVIDLGYWRRHYTLEGSTCYKVCVNHWHPTELLPVMDMPPNRFQKMSMPIAPWRKTGDYILLPGMGQKSYVLYQYPEMSWDLWAAKEIRKYTDRPIIYRPKPSWKNAPPIPDTIYSPPGEPLDEILDKTWAVVNHHSNVGIDALLRGVPVFSWEGAAKHWSSDDLSKIETPYYPTNREKLFHNLAYFNWSIDEIRGGECWDFFSRQFKLK